MDHDIFWDSNDIAREGAWEYSSYLEGEYEKLGDVDRGRSGTKARQALDEIGGDSD